MTLLSDNDDVLFACVTAALEWKDISVQPRQQLLSTVEAVLRVTHRAIAAVCERRNAQVAVTLPTELLVKCFEYLPFNDRLRVSGISRHWRRVALDAPTIWASFSVPLGTKKGKAKLSEMLRRSQAAPLSLKISDHGVLEQSTLGPHYAQLRALDCYNPPPKLNAPSLQSATFRQETTLSKGFLGRSAQTLRMLDLGRFTITEQCPVLANLREFSGEFTRQHDMPGLFALCPSLEALTIRCSRDLGDDPRLIFARLPPTVTEVTVSGINSKISGLGAWANRRFRRLEIGRLADVSAVMQHFDSVMRLPEPVWEMELLDDQGVSYVLHTRAAQTRIIGRHYTPSTRSEVFKHLQKAQRHLTHLSRLSIPLRYFNVCVRSQIELPALTDFTLTVHPERDHDPDVPYTSITRGMSVPRLQSVAFVCQGPAFRKSTVRLFFGPFSTSLRLWMQYDADKLDRMALVGVVPDGLLESLDYQSSAVYSLASAVPVGSNPWTTIQFS